MQDSLESKREELQGWKALVTNPYFIAYLEALDKDRKDSQGNVFGIAPPSVGIFFEREQQIGRANGLQFAIELVQNNINELQQEIRQHESQNSIPSDAT